MIIRTGAKRHTSISNQILEDSALSFEARGLAAYLLSKPEHWKIHVSDLRREGGIGRDKAYGLMTELRDAGYLGQRRVRDAQGRLRESEHVLSDQPDQPFPEIPDTAKPDPAKPDPANQDAYKGLKERKDGKKQKTENNIIAHQGDSAVDQPTGSDKPISPEQQAFDDYNTLAGDRGLPKARVLNEVRRRQLGARLVECGGIEG